MALNSYYVTYDGVPCTTIGIYPVSRPDMPTPEWKSTKTSIAGRDGDLYIEDGTLEDIRITVEFNFSTAPEKWGDTFRDLKEWATSRTQGNYTKIVQLIFSDDYDYCYNVKKTVIGTAERVARRIGRAKVTFICEGWSYLAASIGSPAYSDGTQSITLENSTSYNAYPTYAFNKSSAFTMTLTDPKGAAHTFDILSAGSYRIVINTRMRQVFRLDTGASVLGDTSGDIEDLILLSGTSTLALSVNTLTGINVFPELRTL